MRMVGARVRPPQCACSRHSRRSRYCEEGQVQWSSGLFHRTSVVVMAWVDMASAGFWAWDQPHVVPLGGTLHDPMQPCGWIRPQTR